MKYSAVTIALVLLWYHQVVETAVLNRTGTYSMETCWTVDYDVTNIAIVAKKFENEYCGPVMFIMFSRTLKRALSSLAVFDYETSRKIATRQANYRPVTSPYCIDLPQQLCSMRDDDYDGFLFTPHQKAKQNSCKKWHRGHLSPYNPFRFSQDAAESTDFCVNLAPQDPWTNICPWNHVEKVVETFGKTNHGFVLTGTCRNNNEEDGSTTANRERIPDCWWKLYCYKDGLLRTRVVGFLAPNHLINMKLPADSAEKSYRALQAKTPQSQDDIIIKSGMGRQYMYLAWEDAAELAKNSDSFYLPNPENCRLTLELPGEVKALWANLMKIMPPTTCDENDCEDN